MPAPRSVPLAVRRGLVSGFVLAALSAPAIADNPPAERRLLYAAVDDGVLVFDIDHDHRWVRRIAVPGMKDPKGICANAATQRLYVTHGSRLVALDLRSDGVLWDRSYDSGADRMALTRDGKSLVVPSGFWTKTPYWYVIDASSGDVARKISVQEGTHNTLTGPSGRFIYLSSLRYNYLTVVDARNHGIVRKIGPFSRPIRPFTVNADETLAFVNVDHLLGFEIGDLRTGKRLTRVEVQGYTSAQGKPRAHRCPSHGIGLSPDGKELWVVDGYNKLIHLFDATRMPPVQIATISVSDEPSWITFGIDGRYAYPSTGDVIETATRKPMLRLKDERGAFVMSEKVIEIDFRGEAPVRVGDQFGVPLR